MMVAHNSRGSPTFPCTKFDEEEVANEVQDVVTTLAAIVATTPTTTEDVLSALQVIAIHTLAAKLVRHVHLPIS